MGDKYGMYKVETVGDAYIAGQAEPPLTDRNSPVDVILFGLEMIKATHEWSRNMGEHVSCRVGVHHGKCIGGIVGTEMQRYHLFGSLLTGLEVLESTAPEGKVQVSSACKEAAEQHMQQQGMQSKIIVQFRERTEQLKTSKGEVHNCEEVGGPTFVINSYANLS